MALWSHFSPKSSRKTPTTVLAALIDTCDVIVTPKTATRAMRATKPSARPVNAVRQPLKSPTASTMVSASTHSTAAATAVASRTSMLTAASVQAASQLLDDNTCYIRRGR